MKRLPAEFSVSINLVIFIALQASVEKERTGN